jgi:hypothetical protein
MLYGIPFRSCEAVEIDESMLLNLSAYIRLPGKHWWFALHALIRDLIEYVNVHLHVYNNNSLLLYRSSETKYSII